mgnify:CR=1 FL=1
MPWMLPAAIAGSAALGAGTMLGGGRTTKEQSTNQTQFLPPLYSQLTGTSAPAPAFVGSELVPGILRNYQELMNGGLVQGPLLANPELASLVEQMGQGGVGQFLPSELRPLMDFYNKMLANPLTGKIEASGLDQFMNPERSLSFFDPTANQPLMESAPVSEAQKVFEESFGRVQPQVEQANVLRGISRSGPAALDIESARGEQLRATMLPVVTAANQLRFAARANAAQFSGSVAQIMDQVRRGDLLPGDGLRSLMTLSQQILQNRQEFSLAIARLRESARNIQINAITGGMGFAERMITPISSGTDQTRSSTAPQQFQLPIQMGLNASLTPGGTNPAAYNDALGEYNRMTDLFGGAPGAY